MTDSTPATENPSKAQDRIKVQNGPIICGGVAYLPPDQDSNDTSAEIDYPAISSGKKCKWFAREVKALEDEGSAFFPCFSHGFDRELARVHKEQPNLSYAYTFEHNGEVALWDMTGWESAGLWVDSGGHVCMPIWAQFKDGSSEMRLLYSTLMRSGPREITEEAQWVRRTGKNKGLKK